MATPRSEGPPLDTSREEAAYKRQRDRLVREHLGKIALLRFDKVIGVFDTLDQALEEGHRRFGWDRMIFRQITECDGPDWVSNVDISDPSVRRIDEPAREGPWDDTPPRSGII